MKCRDKVALWDEYVRETLAKGHTAAVEAPSFSAVAQLWGAYSGSGERAAEANMIVEPYLGDLRPANLPRIKVVLLNLNPGPSRVEHQTLSKQSTFGAQLASQPYSDWAASWPYLTNPICENWGGPFMRRRIRYAEELLGESLRDSEVVAVEMFPWHSSRWGHLRADRALPPLRELVLEPLAEIVAASGAVLIGFGKPWQDFAKSIEPHLLQHDLATSKKTGRCTRRFLQYELAEGVVLNLLINAGYAGPPRHGHPDVAVIRQLMRGK